MHRETCVGCLKVGLSPVSKELTNMPQQKMFFQNNMWKLKTAPWVYIALISSMDEKQYKYCLLSKNLRVKT